MLVDLGRNDIGKISKIGTVNVEKYMCIERFSHVMHIGSTVTGQIRDDRDAVDAVDAILPAGTLSGAPKFRACQIIQELEQSKRGIYGGAIGYLDFAGNLDTCIAIRLVYKKNGEICIRSGAGIVADSIPESEFFPAARYHSLAAIRDTLPEELVVTAESEDGEVMALEHKEYSIFGLQFHPESVMTPDGKTMIENFMKVIRDR